MNYFVKRGEQRLGPYSLADLQQRVATLSILPTDLAQSEGMTDWAPIAQIIGNIPAPAPASVGTVYGGSPGTVYGGSAGTVYGGPGAAAAPAMAVDAVPLPPNLHWVLVLILNGLSRVFSPFLLFNLTWAMILANWARKLNGNNNIMVLIAMYPAGFVAGFVALSVNGENGPAIFGLLIIGGAIAYIVGIFKIRSAMQEYYNSRENIGLKLSGGMTFFFSTVYLQYHVNRIAKWKQTGSLS